MGLFKSIVNSGSPQKTLEDSINRSRSVAGSATRTYAVKGAVVFSALIALGGFFAMIYDLGHSNAEMSDPERPHFNSRDHQFGDHRRY